MKKFRETWIFLLAACCLFSCNSDSERVQELQGKILKSKKENEVLQNNNKELENELGRIWTRSMEYRFPDIRPIVAGEDVPENIDSIAYLQAISFRYEDNHTLKLKCTYQPPAKKGWTDISRAHTSFTIYLFDINYGINIHREVIKESLKKKSERVVKEHKINVKSRYTPHYFMIGAAE